jgi:hypothetical protein
MAIPFGLGALSVGAIVSAIAGGYKVAEFLVKVKRLHGVGTENGLFVRIVERVRIDIAETERLLNVPAIKQALSQSPKKVIWIKKTIEAVRQSLEEMTTLTRRVEGDVERGGRVGLRNRLWWVLSEHEKLVHSRMEVAMCHLGLIQVLGFLGALEPMACCGPSGQYEEPDRFVEETTDVRYRDYDQPRRAPQYEDEGYFEEPHFGGPEVRVEEKRGYIPENEVRQPTKKVHDMSS